MKEAYFAEWLFNHPKLFKVKYSTCLADQHFTHSLNYPPDWQ